MSSGLGLPYSISLLYSSTFWGYSKGSWANSNYEFVGIKRIKCYLPQKIHLRCNNTWAYISDIKVKGGAWQCRTVWVLHYQLMNKKELISHRDHDTYLIIQLIIRHSECLPCQAMLIKGVGLQLISAASVADSINRFIIYLTINKYSRPSLLTSLLPLNALFLHLPPRRQWFWNEYRGGWLEQRNWVSTIGNCL